MVIEECFEMVLLLIRSVLGFLWTNKNHAGVLSGERVFVSVELSHIDTTV